MRLFVMSLAVAGVLVSLLALSDHYSPAVEPQFSRSVWNSSLVNHSPYSVVDGIPVALLGVAGYALLGLLAFYHRRLLIAVCSLRSCLCHVSDEHRSCAGRMVLLLRRFVHPHHAYRLYGVRPTRLSEGPDLPIDTPGASLPQPSGF